MTADDPASRGFSLKRWSQRKLEAARAASPQPTDAAAKSLETPAPEAPTPPAAAAATAQERAAVPALPPIDSLTIDSDFSVFLGPKVDPSLKLQALKKLFRDPRFNVMDGLDVYIDDYSIPDPLEPEIARQLAHARYLFDPPRTRVNEAGFVEDVAADEAPIDTGGSLPQKAAVSPEATAVPEATIPTALTIPTASTFTLDATIPEKAAPPVPLPRAASDSCADSATGEATPREGSEPSRR